LNVQEIPTLSAIELAELIRRKTLSPVEVTDAVFARIQELNPKINAFCTLAEESARTEAKKAEQAVIDGADLGPLHGVPFSAKDLIATAGVRTMRGSRIFEHSVPTEDAPAIARLKQAGAILIGKTTTPELGCKGVTDSPISGITLNPWNLERTPGGSSGGASAALAAGLGPLALATDGGGSIRVPAALSGVYGLKPSFGRVPNWPPEPVPSQLHVGPITRTVSDAALMLNVIAGPDGRDLNTLPASGINFLSASGGGVGGLKVAWVRTFDSTPVDAEVTRLTAAAARVFADELGAKVEEIEWSPEVPPGLSKLFLACGIGAFLEDYLPEWEDRLDPTLAKLIESRQAISGVDYAKGLTQRNLVAERVNRLFADYDMLLTPAVLLTAFESGRNPPAYLDGQFIGPAGLSIFTYAFNLTGHPAASVPCGFAANGLPVGLHIVGRRFDDVSVLKASAAFEAARPWRQHWPELAGL
jgi:aspartyl-tRNA(Asn)/glutamyl-tRNA(Gln) amidotransferase subunit A